MFENLHIMIGRGARGLLYTEMHSGKMASIIRFICRGEVEKNWLRGITHLSINQLKDGRTVFIINQLKDGRTVFIINQLKDGRTVFIRQTFILFRLFIINAEI